MKKIFSIILTTLILCSFGIVYGSDYTPRVPRLNFVNIKEIPEVNAGEKLSLNLTLKNDSSYSAQKINITPSIGDLPIVWNRPTDYTTIKSLSKNSETKVSYEFNIREDAKSGTYGIKFDFSFQNGSGEMYSSSQTIYFKIVKEKSKPKLVVENVRTTPEVVSAGTDFSIYFNIRNIGDLEAKSITYTLSGLNKDTFTPKNAIDTRNIEDIKGGEISSQIFSLNASKNIIKGAHSIDVLIKYKDTLGNDYSDTRTIYINDIQSTNEDTSEGGTPKVIINSYSTNPSSIIAGDNINFSFTFTNTNSVKSIKNIKITVSSEDGAFIIAKGSNTFYVENISPKESMQKSIELNVKQDLNSNSYPVRINFDFEDSDGKSYSSTETISLPVTEYSKFVINSVYVSEGYVGSNVYLSFDYINMGKAKVSNLTATVEGDYESKQSINYIGNLDAGNSDYYDIEVIPTKEGEVYGILVLSFEDSSGRRIEARKDFQGFVMSSYQPGPTDPYPVDPLPTPTEEVSGLGMWPVIGISLGSFAVIFIIFKLIFTKIFRKKLEDEI